MSSPRPPFRVALALLSPSPHEKLVLREFQSRPELFTLACLSSLDAAGAKTRPADCDLLLADLDFPGLEEFLYSGSIHCPVVLLASSRGESRALSLLEAGLICDYALASRAQLKRLPLIVRLAALRFPGIAAARAGSSRDALQEAVYEIAQASEKTDSLDELLPRIHAIVSQVMPANNFYIALYDSGSGRLVYPYFVDEQDVLDGTRTDHKQGLSEYVLRKGESLLCTRALLDDLVRKGEIETIGPRAQVWLGAPLIIDGSPIGVMVVQHYSDPSAYGEPEQRMLEFVSSQVATVIRRKQAQQALRLSEERLRSIFENTNIGLGRVGPDGHLLLANASLVAMLGHENFADLQKALLDQQLRSGEGAHRGFWERLQRDGSVRDFESKLTRADGSAIYVREDAYLVRDPAGNPLYYETVLQDISQRRTAELMLQEKVAALQSLAEIDREILAAENPQVILDLVCRRAAELLKAPKAAILTTDGSPQRLTVASHGFEDTELLRRDLVSAMESGTPDIFGPLTVNDFSSDSQHQHASELRIREAICSLILEPFATSSGLRGSLGVFDTEPRGWSEDANQLIRLLAGEAALALEKTRLLVAARRRAAEFAGLHQVAGELMGRRDTNALISLIVDEACRLYQAANAFIYMYDEKTQQLSLTVASSEEIRLGTTLKLGEGMAGRVAQSREPMIIADYGQWSGRSPAYDYRKVLGVVEVPMLFGGDLIGVLGIESMDPSQHFDVEDMRSLSLLAEQAAGALHNARLFSQIEDRNRELDRLARASNTLIAGISSDVPSLCASIAELLVSEFSYSNCSIWLLSEDDLTLSRGAVAGPFSEELKASLLTLRGPGVIAKAIRTLEVVNLGDVTRSPDYLANWDKAKSELVVPMRSGERVVGVIDLQSAHLNAYSADDVRLIELIASRSALMLEHIRLYQQTERRLQQLTVLSNIDAAIASTMDLQVTLNILVSQISMHLHADAVDVLLFNPHLQRLEYAIGRGFRGSQVRRISLLLGEDQAGQAAMERTVVSVFDLDSPEAALVHPQRIAGEGFVCMDAVPLIAKGQLKGVMEIFFRRPVEHSPDWVGFLEVLARQASVAIEDARLFNDMQRSFTDLAVAHDASIEAWARIVQAREHEPEGLLAGISSLTLQLCRRMGIPQSEMPHIHRGVLLHDIGKLSIPDIILFKDGPLTEEEWQVVRAHPAFAFELLQPISYLRPAINIPYCHHERWDGSGYPRSLKGKEIPLEARVFSVVNSWTMLQHDRAYRRAWTKERAAAYVHEQAGREFDPDVVGNFNLLLDEQDEGHPLA